MWATNAKIVGIVLGTLALYTLIANKIPQVQSEVPQALTLGANVTPEQLVAAGQKVYTGIGGCTTCHGLGERAPNLLTDEKGQGPIGARCGKREPEKTCKQYLYESLDNPTAYETGGGCTNPGRKPGVRRRQHRSQSHHPGRRVPRLPQARRAGPGDRARSHARRLAAQRGVDPEEDSRPGVIRHERL